VRYTSLYYYSFGAILRLTVAVPYGEDMHRQAIQKYSFSEFGYIWEIAILLLMMTAYRLIAYIQLRFSKKLQFS